MTDDRVRLRRHPERGDHDPETVHAILDEALFCSIALLDQGRPYVFPTLHARIGDQLYLHGARRGRPMELIGGGGEIALSVTIVDGLVLARSAFRHSINYRSVTLFGRGRLVEGDEKKAALDAIVEHVVRGRSKEARAPNPEELEATAVVAVPIEVASAKIRSGPPKDLEADRSIAIWAGEARLTQRVTDLVPDGDPPMSPSVRALRGVPPPIARGELEIDTDPTRVDLDVVHGFLAESYWARGVPREVVETSIRNSMVFGLYRGRDQVGFARVITDRATFAYLADVFVLRELRGSGLGKWLVETIVEWPELRGVRGFMLGTRDAHGLYAQFGFRPLPAPERYMGRFDPAPYGFERTWDHTKSEGKTAAPRT